MAGIDAELVSHAADLERRDAAIARELESLADAAERAAVVRTRAAELRSALERLPGELEQLARRADAARAEAGAAQQLVASAEERVAALARARRRKQDDLERAQREAATARQLLADAESQVERLHDQREELHAAEPGLRQDAAALVRQAEGIAGELARLPRISDAERLAAGGSLETLEQWGLQVRSAVLVARGTLEAERERIVVEANALAAGALGESLGGSSVTLVRRRLEEAV